jgi:hypothetical protein
MNTFNKALIAVLALQVVLAAITLSRSDSITIAKARPVLPGFEPAEIERIDVYNSLDAVKDGSDPARAVPSIILARKDGRWVIATAFDYPVSETELQSFFDRLMGMQTRGAIATGEARRSQLKVAPDRYLRRVVLHRQGGKPPLTLYVGQNAGPRTSAVRVDGETDIHAVSSFAPSTAPPSVTGWVDSSYFRVDEAQVASITVQNPAGTFSFERDGKGGWKVAEGTTGADPARQLDNRAVDNMVRAMAVLQMIEPADPEIPTGSPLSVVTLRLGARQAQGGEAGSTPQNEYTFVFGPEQNGRYMLRRTGGAPPIWVSMNKFEPVIDFGLKLMYPPTVQQPTPVE